MEGIEEDKVGDRVMGKMNTMQLGRVKAGNSGEALKEAKRWWGGEYTVDSVRLSKNDQSLFAPKKEYMAFGHPRARKGVRRGYRGPR